MVQNLSRNDGLVRELDMREYLRRKMAAELNVLIRKGELGDFVKEKNRESNNIEITDRTGHRMGQIEVSTEMCVIHL